MTKRSYRQNCALARSVDLIGERWSLLLLRDLLLGPRRFGDLQRSLRGIGANLLAARLRDLEAADIVERVALESGGQGYALTERGRALEPALLALIRWGLAWGPEDREGDYHQNDWDLVALKALFQPDRAGDASVSVHFMANDFDGWMTIEDRRITIGPGRLEGADVIIKGTVKDLFMGPKSPDELCLSDPRSKLGQFMGSFALKASPDDDAWYVYT